MDSHVLTISTTYLQTMPMNIFHNSIIKDPCVDVLSYISYNVSAVLALCIVLYSLQCERSFGSIYCPISATMWA